MTITATKERPILFSGPMVRAILAGKKIETRRVVTPQPPRIEDVVAKSGSDFHLFTDESSPGRFRVAGPVWAVRQLMESEPTWKCPYGVSGDRLWVRETWAPSVKAPQCQIAYRADGRCYGVGGDGAGGQLRIFHGWLIDSKVRGDSLGDTVGRSLYQAWRPLIHMPRWASRLALEVVDVRVERVQEITDEAAVEEGAQCAGFPASLTNRGAFAKFWDELNFARGFGWASNPWVWVVRFKVVPPESSSGE